MGKIPKAKFKIYKPWHSFNRKIVKFLYTESIFEEILEKIPEFKMLDKIIENNIVHKKESVFNHTKKVFKNAFDLILSNKIYFNERKIERFLIAVFLHDYGKKFTFKIDKKGLSSCEQHELMSVLKIKELYFLDRFNLENTDKEWILNFIKHHNEIHKIFDNKNTIENLNKFEYQFKDNFIVNLIFGIADVKDSYFKEYNNIEYKRRIQILESELDRKLKKIFLILKKKEKKRVKKFF